MYERINRTIAADDRTVTMLFIGASIALVGMLALTVVPLGDFWVGVSYLAAENGASNEATAGLGVMGVLHSTMHSAIWGAAFGGVAGAAAGIGYGL